MLFHWSLSDSKFFQVSRTFISIQGRNIQVPAGQWLRGSRLLLALLNLYAFGKSHTMVYELTSWITTLCKTTMLLRKLSLFVIRDQNYYSPCENGNQNDIDTSVDSDRHFIVISLIPRISLIKKLYLPWTKNPKNYCLNYKLWPSVNWTGNCFVLYLVNFTRIALIESYFYLRLGSKFVFKEAFFVCIAYLLRVTGLFTPRVVFGDP